MGNNRCILQAKVRKTQQKQVETKVKADDEGFSLFDDEYFEESILNDFKRLRIDDEEDNYDDNENFSKKQKGGENQVYEFQIQENIQEKKEIQKINNEKQQNSKFYYDFESVETLPSSTDQNCEEQENIVYQIEEINYLDQFQVIQKQKKICGQKKVEKKNSQKQIVQNLIKQKIRKI